MSDIRLTWNVHAADVSVTANDLATDDGLETAVILSLFTDRRATSADVLPEGQSDRRGWWGDDMPLVADDRIGSRLWLLGREKQLATVLVRAREYALEALQWLLDDGIAERVEVTAAFGPREGWVTLHVVITKPTAMPVEYRFHAVWTGQAARGGT